MVSCKILMADVRIFGLSPRATHPKIEIGRILRQHINASGRVGMIHFISFLEKKIFSVGAGYY